MVGLDLAARMPDSKGGGPGGQAVRGGRSAVRRRRLSAVLAVCTSLAAPGAAAAADPVVAAAGDIACPSLTPTSGGCRQQATSDLLVDMQPDWVLALGDEQYENGTFAEFLNSYDKSWGRVKTITEPVPGNHEYQANGAKGYFDYFNGPGNAGGRAGDRDKGYYSFDVGTRWHLIALNSNCKAVSCASGSVQEQWLKADLAAHPNQCLLAFWHHARLGSGGAPTGDLRKDLYAARTDLVLGGHDHTFADRRRRDAGDNVTGPDGYHEFTVGTGGRSGKRYGVLKLTLHASSYDWEFVPIPGQTFSSSGTETCHAPPPPPPPPADTTPPAGERVGGPALSHRFQRRASFAVSWGATDAGSGVASYDVRYQRTTAGGVRYPSHRWRSSTAATSGRFRGTSGSTYCFSVRARDRAGNVSVWSAARCTALPLDDTALGRSSGWTPRRGAGFYLGTSSRGTRTNASLLRTTLHARHIAILVTRCPTCGTVQLAWNGRILKTIRLSSPTWKARQLVGRVTFDGVRQGKLEIRIVSAGKRVVVDGLAATTL